MKSEKIENDSSNIARIHSVKKRLVIQFHMESVSNNSGFYIQDGELRTSYMYKLASVLKTKTTIHTVNLSYTGVADSYIVPLIELLKVNISIHTLNLRCNAISDHGATTLAHALQLNTTLQTLNLSGNVIGDAGAVALAKMLTANPTLCKLYLNVCGIESIGAVALSDVLKVNISLDTLDLKGNDIGFVGAWEIITALHVNSTLCTLHLDAGPVCRCFGTFWNMFDHNASLEIFDLHPQSKVRQFLQRNKDGKTSARRSARTCYMIFRMRLGISRDMSRMLSQYIESTKGQMCWVVKSETAYTDCFEQGVK